MNDGPLAQLAESRAYIATVDGSNPSRPNLSEADYERLAAFLKNSGVSYTRVVDGMIGLVEEYRGKFRRRLHNHRHKAKAVNIELLYAKQHGLCCWCKSYCVIVNAIPGKDRLRVANGFIDWRDGEEVFRAKVATLEHLDRISKGGTSDLENLAMACQQCNGKREKKTAIQRVCQRCDMPLRAGKKGKYCGSCTAQVSIEWLTEHGWTIIPNDDGNEFHTKFRDPQTGVNHILRIACKILSGQLDERNGTHRKAK